MSDMFSDVSSSRETIGLVKGHFGDKILSGNGRYSVGKNVYTEDESSDSAASSEFSSTQVASNSGTVPPNKAYASEGYTSSVPSRVNVEGASKKVSQDLILIWISWDVDL